MSHHRLKLVPLEEHAPDVPLGQVTDRWRSRQLVALHGQIEGRPEDLRLAVDVRSLPAVRRRSNQAPTGSSSAPRRRARASRSSATTASSNPATASVSGASAGSWARSRRSSSATGRLALPALRAERAVAAHGVGPGRLRLLLDRRGERLGGERLPGRMGLGERGPLDVEALADRRDRVLELCVRLLGAPKVPPAETVTVGRRLRVGRPPEPVDPGGEVCGRAVDQRARRAPARLRGVPPGRGRS